LALERVLGDGTALNGRQNGPCFIRDPTTGALEDSMYMRLEANRAIISKPRVLKLRLYLSLARLRGLLLGIKSAHMQTVRDTNRYLFHLRRHGHVHLLWLIYSIGIALPVRSRSRKVRFSP
jgi:hypothetical protein